jgi:hypothetical protein
MITITNTGSDTFISDGTQNPNRNRQFNAGMTKATVISNPITAALDAILVIDSTGMSIIIPYSDISSINGNTPLSLGLTNATEVASYLNNNFFDFGDTIVSVVSPLTGNGTLLNPIKLIDGTDIGQIIQWNGTNWIYSTLPSDNIKNIKNEVVFTFGGGFQLSGGGSNANNLVGTPLYRNSNLVAMLTPGVANRPPIIVMPNISGNRTRLATPNVSGSYFNVSTVVGVPSATYIVRCSFAITTWSSLGSCYFGFIQEPGITITGGFFAEIVQNNIRLGFRDSFVNTTISGSNVPISLNTWYDVELNFHYDGTNVTMKLYINNVLVSTLNYTPAGNCPATNAQLTVTNAGSNNVWVLQTDRLSYAIQ